MSFITGKNSRIIYNGVNLEATQFTIDTQSDEIDVTNFESTTGGEVWGDYLASFKNATVTFEVIFNSDNQGPAPLANLPGLEVGNEATLDIYVNRNALFAPLSRYHFNNFLVLDVNVTSEVRGVVRFSVRGRARRGYTCHGT